MDKKAWLFCLILVPLTGETATGSDCVSSWSLFMVNFSKSYRILQECSINRKFIKRAINQLHNVRNDNERKNLLIK